MDSLDDRKKELKNIIQESSKRLSGMWTPLAVHGQLLAATSEYSGILIEELTASVEKLSASSKRLEFLTDILIFLTFFLALLEITDLYLNHPGDEIVKFIYFLFIAALIAAFSNRIFGFLRKRWNKGFSKDL